MDVKDGNDGMANRLANELSPYLLQHADNPVDWYAWGDEAFERSRAEAKPIFLSIGYSTCHWCHVMAHESFENEDVASLLNQQFVSVKVDREERPDVDRVYMAFVQATTDSGGWPMSVWLTPTLRPFFGGTYFPPTSRYGRPGFIEVLTRMAEMWSTDRVKLVASADQVMKQLHQAYVERSSNSATQSPGIAPVETIKQGCEQFERIFDTTHGGFGRPPKFPRPSELLLLMREYYRSGNLKLRDMALETLRAMVKGGIRDHVGGGFHRYSVDGQWRIPHFEKMLYDQAQLALACLEAGQLTGDADFFQVAIDTLDYVARELTGVEGGFLSAQDADSVSPEHVAGPKAHSIEGAFYLWTQEELEDLLGNDADIVVRRFGVEASGNAPHDPTGEFLGKNQFFLAKSLAEVAHDAGMEVAQVQTRLSAARTTLREHRATRPHPHLDDKVLAAWNGLMIAAAARAARVVPGGAPQALQMAERAAGFVRDTLWDSTVGVLRRCYREGRASIDGYCEDYAFVIWGLLELFQSTGNPEWLVFARQLQSKQDELFWDGAEGGWYSTTGQDSSVLLRVKDDYDGAEPSAGSVSVLNLLTISHLDADADAVRKAEKALARFGLELGHTARMFPLMTAALAQYHTGLTQVVILGPSGRADTEELTQVLRSVYLPFSVVVHVQPGSQQVTLAQHLPFTGTMTMLDGKATAYLCTGFSCQEPTTTPENFEKQLRALHKGM